MLYGQPSPVLVAQAHAKERPGLVWKLILPTGSMEPLITGGDTVVIDTTVRFRDVKPGQVCLYLPAAHKLPNYPGLAPGVPILHMLAAWVGDEAIMDGIANREYEGGKLRLTEAEFLGVMIRGYTRRERP